MNDGKSELTKFIILKRFHKDLATVKAHNWKFFFDLYHNCFHGCSYCLYGSSESLGKEVQTIAGINVNRLILELDSMSTLGITYLGATSDIYQPIEKRTGFTRSIIEVFLKKELPLVLATKSSLILRDVDILSSLARKGLVEVSITMTTLDDKLARVLEPNAPLPKERLTTARKLTEEGIPVSFHVAPLIPGYFTDKMCQEFILALRETGSDGMYACILGIRKSYRDLLIGQVRKIYPILANYLSAIYQEGKEVSNALAPFTEIVAKEMLRFSILCKKYNFGFYCEHIPAFDTSGRSNGIFRFKLPTTGDMFRYFVDQKINEIGLNDLQKYLSNFSAVDEDYRNLVTKLWKDGILFQDTNFMPLNDGLSTRYILKENIDLKIEEVMTCD